MIAVGNGRNDLPMLRVAGTSIGFQPDSYVDEQCDVVGTSTRKLHLYFQQHDIVETE
jgi:phosphoserine phosphatase